MEEDGKEGSNDENALKHYKEGNAHFERDEFQLAIEYYTLALLLNPKLENAYYNRGLAHAIAQELDDALEDLAKVLELNPKAADAYYAQGLVFERSRRNGAARASYLRSLFVNPDYEQAARRLALIDANADKNEDSDNKEEEKDAEPREVSELENAGRLSEALDRLNEKLIEKPDDPELTLQKSIITSKLAKAPPIKLCGLQKLWSHLNHILILPLKHHNAEIYQAEVVKSSRGILLYGPPGCGKTLVVSHLARDGGITMIKVTLAETLNLYVGESEKRLKRAFDEAILRAKREERVLLFIDEVDALGFARGGGPDHEATWSRQLVGTFLGCFDEIQAYNSIAVVGATNDPFSVDNALRRPGRLGGTTIYIPPPNTLARHELFELFARETPREDDVDLAGLARMTKWFSGDDIRKICRDVHFKIAAEIIEGRRKKAEMADYLATIRATKSSASPWFLDLQRRLAEGAVDTTLLESELEQDLKDFANDYNSKNSPSFAVR